ncbi:MAG: hypothetical protein OEW99_11115 [Gammaproteobacteria bacterium]|nr:hypothetical protein [Gammaproteobacteria bacterium]
MQSTLENSRMFNDKDGWYIFMRIVDKKNLTGSKHKVVEDQHLMGPFKSKDKAEEWLEGYIAKHGENRQTDEFIPDSMVADE